MKIYVKEWRIIKGMTQEELAKDSGVTRQTIYKLEHRGEGKATIKTLKSIADALKVDFVSLFYPPTETEMPR